MKKVNKLIAVLGASGSGKDTIVNRLRFRIDNVSKLMLYTSRPQRSYEEEGVDYYFRDEDFFNTDDFLIKTDFVYGHYGIKESSFSKDVINVTGQISPRDIFKLPPSIETKIFVLDVADSTRLKRLLDREVNPDIDEIFRRYYSDKNDFELFEEYIKLNNIEVTHLVNENSFQLINNVEKISYAIRAWTK